MIISTTDSIAGYEIVETIDIARGSTVRARHLGRDIFAGLKNLVGGEIQEYTELKADAREQSLDRMKADAEQLGADAIVNVRFMTAMVMQGASEILAYGTAVKIRKIG
ncbi:MAG: YbjQ family protein [Bacteroidota bacterium]